MHNVSQQEYDSYGQTYDIYRKKLTANRTPLYLSTLPEIAMDFMRGVSSKYDVHLDTAVRWMIVGGRFFLHSTLAQVGKQWDPLKLDMCVHLNPIQSVAGLITACLDL